ncbi:HD domain-containing protein [Halomonadaceae bacterium KBTZ08]
MPHGRTEFPIKTPEWLRLCSVVTRLAGLSHDAGKNTHRFQSKLASAIKQPNLEDSPSTKDRWRHEWISAHVLNSLLEACTGKEHDENDSDKRHDPGLGPFFPSLPDSDLQLLSRKNGHQLPITSIDQALIACVLTHHGLLHSPDPNTQVHASKWGHCRAEPREQTRDQYRPFAELAPETIDAIHDARKTLQALSHHSISTDGLRALTLLCRAALIGADHEVSSWRYQGPFPDNQLFANTQRPPKDSPAGSSRIRRRSTPAPAPSLNQPLDFHLMAVADKAQALVQTVFSIGQGCELPGLSQDSRQRLATASPLPEFEWQDIAATRLAQDGNATGAGTLVFNMAGTGSGKTLANVKLAQALTPEGMPCRLSIALNLRTLTLQTADALKEAPAALRDDEVNCLIGDRLTQAFHTTPNTDEDDGATDNEADRAIDMAHELQLQAPQWLEDWCRNQKDSTQTKAFLMAPALVSTTDYLVKAGDPSAQNHHVRALLRLASSDLILDEVDGYDPKALISIGRMVMVAALFGRNVICSSATLSEPVAACLGEAFATGQRMRHGLMGGGSRAVKVAFIDNELPPEVQSLPPETMDMQTPASNGSSFSAGLFRDRINRLVDLVSNKPVTQLAFIKDIDPPSSNEPDSAVTAFSKGIGEAIDTLHQSQSWMHEPTGKTISFGVVRVAHVQSALTVARQLQSIPERDGASYYVTTYHSSDIAGRRLLKERQFDRMFRRKSCKGDEPARSPEIDRILRASQSQNVVFIVVATPVEEVGRDHDFDWAVIEPSSVASIVQLSGRVNRHRRARVSEPNIAIMDQTIRSLQGIPQCFQFPGNGLTYKEPQQRRMAHLLASAPGWKNAAWQDATLAINCSLRFGDRQSQCQFSIDDDTAYAERYSDGALVLKSHETALGNQYGLAWMTRDHYIEFPLRDSDQQREYSITNPTDWDESLIPRDASLAKYVQGQKSPSPTDEVTIKPNEQPRKTWAAPSVKQVHEILSAESLLAEDNGLALFTFRVSMPPTAEARIEFDPLFGGGRSR